MELKYRFIPSLSAMLQALLEGKLSTKEKSMEDLLTSNVFGSIKYLEPSQGLVKLLTASEDIKGNKFPNMVNEIIRTRYEFWPQLKQEGCNPCEPDVLITIQFANGEKLLVLVEAKYHSGKSSLADNGKLPMDQLAREWHNLTKRASATHSLGFLLFVTSDIFFPYESILESQEELEKKGVSKMDIYWLSWRKIASIFSSAMEDSILADLVKVLRKEGLIFYEGKLKVTPIDINWSFTDQSWNWQIGNVIIGNWQFGKSACFKWRLEHRNSHWGFKV